MDASLAALSAVRTLSAVCAGALMVFAYRAYLRSGSSPLRWLATASLLLSLGFLGAGLLYQATQNLLYATMLEAPFTLAALLVIMLSLFGRNVSVVRPSKTGPLAKRG